MIYSHLNVYPLSFGQAMTVCSGQSVIVGSHSYSVSGIYEDTLTATSGCDSIITTNLTVLPSNTSNQTIILCYGQSLTVGSYIHTVSGIYSDTLLTETGCDSIVVSNLTVIPLLTASITPSGPITFCTGNSVTLTAGGPNNYLWSNSSTSQSINVSSSGNYFVTVTDANNCSASTSVSVTVNPLPASSITPNGPTTFCSGNSVTLTAGGANNYLWSTSSASQSINVSSTGNYFVTVTDANNCSASTSVSVIVNPLPAASITPNGSTTFCSGNSVALTAGGANNYLWSNSSTSQSINVSSSGNYFVTVTDGNNCSASTSVSVTVNPLPAASITPDGPTTFCSGNSVTLTAAGANNYLWSNNSTSQSINVSSSGNYFVTVTDGNNCSASTSVNITVNPNPAAPNIMQVFDSLVSDMANSYQWYFNNMLISGATSQAYHPTQNGNYSVVISDVNGCTSSSTSYPYFPTSIHNVSTGEDILIYPNPATKELAISSKQMAIEEIKIFDIVGQVIFQQPLTAYNKLQTVDVSEFIAGIYFIHVKTEFGIIVRKFVKE
jgi:hypothetical protein